MLDNSQITKFCNEGLRPTANQLVAAYNSARQLIEVYDATGIDKLLPSDETFSNYINDGSEVDGRPQISVGGIKLIITNIRALLEQLETTETPTGLSLVQGIISVAPRFAG